MFTKSVTENNQSSALHLIAPAFRSSRRYSRMRETAAEREDESRACDFFLRTRKQYDEPHPAKEHADVAAQPIVRLEHDVS